MQQQPEVRADAPPDANLFPFVRSLDGTRPDGSIRVEEGEALVADAGIVRLFDYYLSTVGEKPLEAIRAEIERDLDARLKPRAAAEAKDLLRRYLDYKRALVKVDENPKIAGGSVEAVRARLAAVQQMRAQFFSATETHGMFGEEDMLALDAVARLEIGQDRSLDEAQKAEKLAALDAALPAPLREERDAPLAIIRLEEAANRLRSQGASEDDVYRMRAGTLTPEAAARMAEVDREEAAWKARIGAYLSERTRLLGATEHHPPSEREDALQRLRQAHFSADEQKRLAAYE